MFSLFALSHQESCEEEKCAWTQDTEEKAGYGGGGQGGGGLPAAGVVRLVKALEFTALLAHDVVLASIGGPGTEDSLAPHGLVVVADTEATHVGARNIQEAVGDHLALEIRAILLRALC